MMLVINNNKGKTIISKDVIASIANLASMECYGLAGIPSKKISEGIFELMGWDTAKRGVKVEITEDNKLILEVGIIVIYGTKISEVAQNVMEKVHYTLQDTIGEVVEKVNVKVHGVRLIE